MIQTEGTILIGTSELRKMGPKAWQKLSRDKLILTQRGKPLAVLEDYEQHQEKERIIAEFEDMVLGHLAKERLRKKGKVLSSSEVERFLFAE